MQDINIISLYHADNAKCIIYFIRFLLKQRSDLYMVPRYFKHQLECLFIKISEKWIKLNDSEGPLHEIHGSIQFINLSLCHTFVSNVQKLCS
jgi:hypothetical protein